MFYSSVDFNKNNLRLFQRIKILKVSLINSMKMGSGVTSSSLLKV